MRALVVDDSKTIRFVICRFLKENGFEVFEADNGTEALSRLEEVPAVDLATVDWNMPEMSGIEFVQAARAEPAYRAMKIIMVTTESESEQINQALTSGANDFIVKPFDKELMKEKLQALGML